ncbi:MAG: PfkB family carbohydrate kinase, partial [Vicinamibacteria bacterium]
MILVVCPNLAVDVTLEIETLEPGSVHRAGKSRKQAGGKGVNLARALRSLGPLGEEPLVLGFVGGRTGDEIASGLAAEGIPSELVSFPGESRTCT